MEISSGFISCSRGSPLPSSPVTTDGEHSLPRERSHSRAPVQPGTTLLVPTPPPKLVPTPCQVCQQCQAGTRVTKPVGVCRGAGDNPIMLRASPPTHYTLWEQRVPILV